MLGQCLSHLQEHGVKTFDDLKKMPANDLKAIGFKPEVRLSVFPPSLLPIRSWCICCVIGFGLNARSALLYFLHTRNFHGSKTTYLRGKFRQVRSKLQKALQGQQEEARDDEEEERFVTVDEEDEAIESGAAAHSLCLHAFRQILWAGSLICIGSRLVGRGTAAACGWLFVFSDFLGEQQGSSRVLARRKRRRAKRPGTRPLRAPTSLLCLGMPRWAFGNVPPCGWVPLLTILTSMRRESGVCLDDSFAEMLTTIGLGNFIKVFEQNNITNLASCR